MPQENNIPNKLLRAMHGIVLTVGTAFPLVASALDSDFEAPIGIEAEYVEVNSADRSSVYRGNVSLERGSMKITADEVNVSQDKDDGTVRASVVGKPATYSQIPRRDSERVFARADRMEYNSSDAVIRLVGNARVNRGSDEITGSEIRYHMREDRIIAGGDGDERVRIVIQPPKSTDNGDASE